MTATGSVGLEPVVRRRRVRKLEREVARWGDLRGFKARHRILDERREELVRSTLTSGSRSLLTVRWSLLIRLTISSRNWIGNASAGEMLLLGLWLRRAVG